MKYFILCQDERVTGAVEPVGISPSYRQELLTEEGLSKIEEAMLHLSILDNGAREYLDFIQRPIPLLSDELKKLIARFVPQRHFKTVILRDMQHMNQELYWLFVPQRVNGVSSETEFHKNGALKRLVMNSRQVTGYHLFTLEGILENHWIVSLALAESIYRRDFKGIHFTPVECIAK
jgi:hypothetical protein